MYQSYEMNVMYQSYNYKLSWTERCSWMLTW